MNNLSNNIFDFLNELKMNNDREWFQKNKSKYQQAREEFIQFITELIDNISKFDKEIADVNPKKAIFRIYRDTRFSNNKLPYKINFGAHITAGNSKVHDRAGYYIHIEPKNCFLAGGAYLPPSRWISAIRKKIEKDGDLMRKIINGKEFRETFGELVGEKLKTAPRGYTVDHPEIELLRYKSFLVDHGVQDDEVLESGFIEYCNKVFKLIKPFDDFLNTAISEY